MQVLDFFSIKTSGLNLINFRAVATMRLSFFYNVIHHFNCTLINMKTKFNQLVRNVVIIAASVSLSFVALSAVSLTGCGPGNPTDEELDRPDVPPSTRGNGKGAEAENLDFGR